MAEEQCPTGSGSTELFLDKARAAERTHSCYHMDDHYTRQSR
jgi:hypothetical protein